MFIIVILTIVLLTTTQATTTPTTSLHISPNASQLQYIGRFSSNYEFDMVGSICSLNPNTTAIKHVLTFHSLIQSSSISSSSLPSLNNTSQSTRPSLDLRFSFGSLALKFVLQYIFPNQLQSPFLCLKKIVQYQRITLATPSILIFNHIPS